MIKAIQYYKLGKHLIDNMSDVKDFELKYKDKIYLRKQHHEVQYITDGIEGTIHLLEYITKNERFIGINKLSTFV